METAVYVDNAKVMAKGQVTIPCQIRKILNVQSGDNVTFIVENGKVMVVNTAVYALKLIQRKMADVSMTEEEIQNLLDEERHGR